LTRARLRRTASALSAWERPLLLWLAARLPAWATPDGMTAAGLAGALVCAAGYALAARSTWGLLLASVGLALNWFGDSLDGTLARFRMIERPRYGYFLDNGLDMVEQLVIAVGVGLSGYVRWDLCFLALSVLFMMSSLSALRACVSPVHQLAYGGFGLTELRLAGIGLNALVALVPPQRVAYLRLPISYPNIVVLLWSLLTLLLFLISFAQQTRALAREEPSRPRTGPAGAADARTESSVSSERNS
jgi:phosphatidylglycerophosphate synthase